MRWIALGAFVLLLVAPAQSVQGTGAERGARQSALRLLEPALTVPGVATSPVTTKTTLRRGASYRLVVTGTVAGSITRPDGVTIGETEDAFYCFAELNEAAVDPSSSCTRNIRYLGALRARIGGFNDHVHGALGLQGPPAYQPSHRYELNFRAPRTGKLSFVSTKLPALSPVGSFRLELYGSGAKKKRKKRIRACPAARASSPTVRAASTCHWVVDFEINQSGRPRESRPDPSPAYVDSETIAVGKVFFSAEPRAGRTSIGRAAGAFTHIDSYTSAVPPFFIEGEVKTTPQTARYTLGRGEIRLRLDGTVNSVTGPVYSQDPRGRSTQVGDPGRFQAVYDFPRHRDDTLTTYFGCSSCTGPTDTWPGEHGHHFVVLPDTAVRVTISRPRSLAGACRCKG